MALLAIFCASFLLPVMTQYSEKFTNIAKISESADKVEVPTFSICTGWKKSIMDEYKITSEFFWSHTSNDSNLPTDATLRNVLMPLGWDEGRGFFLSRVACHEWKEKIIPKRVTKAHLDSPRVTSGVATSDEWGIQMGLEWRVWELFLWLLLSLKALSFL